MYCKKCKKLIENSHCTYCGHDNNYEFNLENTAEIELQKIVDEQLRQSKREKVKVLPIICTVIGMFVIGFGIYYVKETHQKNEVFLNNSGQYLISKKEFKFKYKNLRLVYPDSFGATKSTIFYKINPNINIVIKAITQEEYNNMLNANDIIDGKINDLEIKSFAGDNFYSDLLFVKDTYYAITVNYLNDLSEYNQDIQLTISKIINSLTIK